MTISRRTVFAGASTLSRDIRELGLVKVRGSYQVSGELHSSPPDEILRRAFEQFVIRTGVSGNIVMIRTSPGNAHSVGVVLDAMGRDFRYPLLGSRLARHHNVVGVIFGGRSGEHEVSLVSASSIIRALDPAKYEVVPIGITREGRWLSSGRALALLKERAGLDQEPERLLVPDPAPQGLVACALRTEQQLLPARAGQAEVDGGEDALIGQLPVQHQLHVARPLELLEDQFVHAAARIDQGRADDGQRAAFLEQPGGGKELLGDVQGFDVHAAAHGAAGVADPLVERPGQSGDRIQEQKHVLAHLGQAPAALDRVLPLHVLLGLVAGNERQAD